MKFNIFPPILFRYADVMVHRLLDLGLKNEEEARLDSKNPIRMKEYSKIAEQCNVMKLSSRKVQEASDELFLAVYLQDHHMYADAAVVGLGPKTFQVMVRCLGETFKLFVDEMSGIQHHFDERAQELTLIAAPKGQNGGQREGQGQEQKRNNEKVLFTHPNILVFEELKLSLASPVVVYLTSKSEGHLTTRCSLVCAGTCASKGFLNANFESAAAPVDLISNTDDDDT
jgi:hypothetical protein